MAQAEITVREGAGCVDLILRLPGEAEPTVITLDGSTARKLGDDLFKAGCRICF